jgi:CheY-like chemotaxis protein
LSKSRVILCVGDEATALAVRSQVLSRAGYVVLTASDGAAALEVFKCIRADLIIIMDHGLPGLSGAQVASEMKRLTPAVPIVFLSGLLEAPLGSEYADLVITKGMPRAEFLRAVGKLIPQ